VTTPGVERYYEEPDVPSYEEPVSINSHHTTTYDSLSKRTTRDNVKLDEDLYVSDLCLTEA
jgi:hypothetical protein